MLPFVLTTMLFVYLMTVGSHIVVARLLIDVWQFNSHYWHWWHEVMSLPSRFLVYFFFPAVAYTLLQIHLLRKALMRG